MYSLARGRHARILICARRHDTTGIEIRRLGHAVGIGDYPTHRSNAWSASMGISEMGSKMRVNVYTEELEPSQGVIAEIVTADYVSSRTGDTMTNYGIRIYLKSHPDLHYVPPRDDDRSAVTFWCGPSIHET